jgi:thymidylate synthase (FAD)
MENASSKKERRRTMNVRLISYSQTNSELYVGNDMQELIAYCARVSNPSNQINEETSERLLRYLIKHKHWSPFEMVSACLEIETYRDIARQILRHRSFSFQEFSQRYADPTKDFSLNIDNLRKARLQDTKNRQNSIEVDDDKLQLEWQQSQMRMYHMSKKEYDAAIKLGIAKEQARALLPEGITESRLYMNGSIRSWIHYIELRSGPETQKEHRDIAIACAKAIEPIFPMINEFIV